MKKVLFFLLTGVLLLASCKKTIEQRASAALEEAVKNRVDGQPYEIRDKEVVFKTDSDCVTYFVFHYQGKDVELEHLYTIREDSTIWESIGNRTILQKAEEKYAELLENNSEEKLKKEKRDFKSITRINMALNCVIYGHKIEKE